jgi:hypothetical protein
VPEITLFAHTLTFAPTAWPRYQSVGLSNQAMITSMGSTEGSAKNPFERCVANYMTNHRDILRHIEGVRDRDAPTGNWKDFASDKEVVSIRAMRQATP